VEALVEKGHRVVGVESAEALLELPAALRADLMVIDLNLPGEDGISLARRLRQAQPSLGIVMLTARARAEDKIAGYESGADIYLAKPVSVEELAAAVGALSTRLKGGRPGYDCRLHLASRTLSGPGGQTALTALECALLAALARAPGRRLEYWQLLEQAGRLADDAGKAMLEAPVSRLRAKFAAVGKAGNPIKSIRRFGYQLCADVALD
ncbi:MAG: response regulator transcription factor, partial [Rhodocyclaceae bacterium]|nr:response regulator transcription factor [Rhodocyclaceae bacterium]